MLIKNILALYKPDNKLSDDNFVFAGSFPTIVKHVNAIYNELHGFPNHYMGSFLKGIGFVYTGVVEGRQLPPYQWGEHSVNKVYRCTDSIRSGVVMLYTEGWNGHTDAPEEECYLFKITEEGLGMLIVAMFRGFEQKVISSYEVLHQIKEQNEFLWNYLKYMPNIDLGAELGTMGF